MNNRAYTGSEPQPQLCGHNATALFREPFLFRFPSLEIVVKGWLGF